MKGWYFSTLDKKLRFNDNRDIAIGVTHKVDCEPVLCESGLHLSPTVFDALQYAPGPVLWRVVGGGKIVHGNNKSACTERTYIAGGVDISDTLRRFARLCAWDAACAAGDATDTARNVQRRRLASMVGKIIK